MRSYIYDGGSFHPCKDSLPPTANSNSNYSEWSAFSSALDKLGFSTLFPSSFTSRLGYIKVYARDHAALNAERKPNETHDFLCTLRIGRSYIRVWINDFPTLIQFFQEVDARGEDELSDDVRDFLKNSSLKDALANFASTLSSLEFGDIEITVKAPKPPVRRS